MKRLIYRLIVGLITFTTGLSLSSIWKQSHGKLELASQGNLSSVQIQDLESAGTICEVDAHPQLYLGKRIRLRGWFAKSNEHGFASEVERCPGASSYIILKLTERESLDLFALPKYQGSSAEKLLNIEVVGHLEPTGDRDNIFDLYMSDARITRVFSMKIIGVLKFAE